MLVGQPCSFSFAGNYLLDEEPLSDSQAKQVKHVELRLAAMHRVGNEIVFSAKYSAYWNPPFAEV
jgi:hypothetical protein